MEAIVTRALAMLDALDGDSDLEPDFDGEAEPDEASSQPLMLAADRLPPSHFTPDAGEYPANVIAFPRRLRLVQVTA